jgi:hypothetical protein
MLAGVDVFGVKEAFQADPAGTAGAVTLDAVGAALLALIADWAMDEFNSDKDTPKTPSNNAQDRPNPGAAVWGQGNTLTVPSGAVDGPIYIGGEDNSVHVYEPEPVTAAP